MRAADEAALAGTHDAGVFIARAGHAVAEVARTMMGGAYGRSVVVIAGKGNNGADGRVAARTLSSWGASVRVHPKKGQRTSSLRSPGPRLRA